MEVGLGFSVMFPTLYVRKYLALYPAGPVQLRGGGVRCVAKEYDILLYLA